MGKQAEEGADMAEMRTADVDNLLSVLAALDDEDTIFALLEDFA